VLNRGVSEEPAAVAAFRFQHFALGRVGDDDPVPRSFDRQAVGGLQVRLVEAGKELVGVVGLEVSVEIDEPVLGVLETVEARARVAVGVRESDLDLVVPYGQNRRRQVQDGSVVVGLGEGLPVDNERGDFPVLEVDPQRPISVFEFDMDEGPSLEFRLLAAEPEEEFVSGLAHLAAAVQGCLPGQLLGRLGCLGIAGRDHGQQDRKREMASAASQLIGIEGPLPFKPHPRLDLRLAGFGHRLG